MISIVSTISTLSERWMVRTQPYWYLAFWLLLSVVPPLTRYDAYFLHIMILSMIMAALASSWNLISGFTGMFSFGHQAFFGIGAYVSALLAIHTGIPPLLAMLLAGIFAAMISLAISTPCLRLRGTPQIAIATLSFAEIWRIVATNLVQITRGELGLWGIPELFANGNRVAYYYAILAILALILWVISNIIKSPLGLAFRSVRDAPDAAEALGVDVAKTKILAFSISSFMAGLVGAFYAHYLTIIAPSSVLSVDVMIGVVAITLLGGLGTLMGPVVAAFVLTLGLELMRPLENYGLLIYGAIIILLILLMPGGIASASRRWVDLSWPRAKRNRKMIRYSRHAQKMIRLSDNRPPSGSGASTCG